MEDQKPKLKPQRPKREQQAIKVLVGGLVVTIVALAVQRLAMYLLVLSMPAAFASAVYLVFEAYKRSTEKQEEAPDWNAVDLPKPAEEIPLKERSVIMPDEK